jgi:hypothetical protein
MKFCQKCGQTLSILTNSNEKYCKQCKPSAVKAKPVKTKSEPTPDIFSASISCKDGKITLTSKEGWILWSGPIDQEHTLQNIIDRAGPILKIRSKRKK